jgi:hypothetical protein
MKDTKQVGDKVLAALKELDEMKDLAIVSKRMEGKSWFEIVGRIDVPAGSKAFWAMIKKEITEREPYNLFIRFDMNAEGETIEDARASVKSWVENNVIPKIQANTEIKSIKVLQPNDVFMPKLN